MYADYRINLIAPHQLSDEEIDEFHTNFREVMKYIKYSKDKKKLAEVIRDDERFKSVERQAVDVINFTTGSKVKYSERKGAMDVCLAIQEMREESEIIGAIRSDKKRGISQDETKQYIMEEYQKDAKEADELIQTYWK